MEPKIGHVTMADQIDVLHSKVWRKSQKEKSGKETKRLAADLYFCPAAYPP
jgi:hypothetical protein